MMKVIFNDELFSRLEGTVANIPLDLPEKKPLSSPAPKPLWFWEYRLL